MIDTAIFNKIKEDFCSLWAFKERGNTIEIVTPFSTTTSKFISIFITSQNGEFIVTDGGWISNGEYGTIMDLDDDVFLRIYNHYLTQYEIKTVIQKQDVMFYYKKSDNLDMLSSMVYDLGYFTSSVLGASQIQFYDEKEKGERDDFKQQADGFISSLVTKGTIIFNRELSDDYKNVRFNAIITERSKLKLIRYITGSTSNYFLSSLTKATVDFEIANHSEFNKVITERIALVNDTANGFDKSKLFRYIETLQDHTKRDVIKWSERENLESIIG